MKVSISVGVFLLVAALHAQADVPAQVSTCAACHGAQGQGNPLVGAPRLAGQQDEYLLTQLHNFREGRRGYDGSDTYGAQMRAVAAGLSDSDIELLARYYAVQTLAEEKVVESGIEAQGETTYKGTCASCHGPKGEGFAHLKTPNLSILDSAYVERQLTHYVQGARGGENHADELGVWMRGISLQLAGENERKAIAKYIGSLPSTSSSHTDR